MTRSGVRYLPAEIRCGRHHRGPGRWQAKRSIRILCATPQQSICSKAGVDFATISQWLGHASLNTTMRYARADIDLQRQALAQVFPEVLEPPKGGGAFAFHGDGVIGWLHRP